MANEYKLGRGKIYFSRFKPGTQVPAGYRYIGNSPELNLTIESENLDHFSSDEGIREKDDSVPLEVTRSGSMVTDNIVPENVAMFFFGERENVVTVGANGLIYDIENVVPGYSYKIGQTAVDAAGHFGLNPDNFNVFQTDAVLTAATGTVTFTGAPANNGSIDIGGQVYRLVTALNDPFDVLIGGSVTATAANLVAAINGDAGEGSVYGTGTQAHPDVSAANAAGVVTVTSQVEGTAGNAVVLTEDATNTTVSGSGTLAGGTGVSYVEGVDYTVDYDAGVLHLLETGAIVEGSDVSVDYGTRSSSRERVISGSSPVEGAMLYVEKNPKGRDFTYVLAWLKITPNGDYALKGDEWQSIPFNLEILKPANGGAAIQVNGKPAYV
jgi:hypothetical protein